MRTKFYFLLAAAALLFAACEEKEVKPDEPVIKVYQGSVTAADGTELTDNTTITVSELNDQGQVIFDGYVENITDDYENIMVRVQLDGDASQELCQADGTCLPTSTEYRLAEDLRSTDYAGFSAHCKPNDATKAAEFKAVYTFYAEEYPENTVTVNVVYQYTPAE